MIGETLDLITSGDYSTLWLVLAGLLACGLFYLVQGQLLDDQIPTINHDHWDWTQEKAKKAFMQDAQALIDKGTQRYPDRPFRIITALSERVFLPYSWIDWIRTQPDLDHQASVVQDFFGGHYSGKRASKYVKTTTIPGFEAIGAFDDENHTVIELVKKGLSRISQAMIDTFSEHASIYLDEHFGDSKQFHDINWGPLCFKMTAAVSSSIFSGSTLAQDPEWQDLITFHTMNVFNAARSLRSYPAWLRKIVHWFLPECKALRSQLEAARTKVASYELQDEDSGSVLAATKDAKSPDAAVIQLALAAGAIHTSSQLIQQVLLDLALASTRQPDVINALRSEIETVLQETDGRLVPASLTKLTLLDACIKETQRLKPQTLNNLERVALKDITLPNGQVIRRGAQIAVPSSPMWSADNWGADSDIWNPYRYESVNEKMGLVSSNNKHYAFGMGKFICPGRFFLTAEIKVVLVQILTNWDLRIRKEWIERGIGERGYVEWHTMGFEQLANSDVVVQVRRRR